jgi:hypothetical protein
MNNFCLLPVMPTRTDLDTVTDETSEVMLDAAACARTPHQLWQTDEGRLIASARAEELTDKKENDGGKTLLATIACTAGPNGKPAWWFLPRSPRLTLTGHRPLPLAAAEAGQLLACGPQQWLVTTRWMAQPQEAPAAMAHKTCPLCDGPLSLTTVVQCPCGRYYHLEDSADPEHPDKLNCYLTGPCGMCGRAPTLEPRWVPDARDLLLVPPAPEWDV